MCLFFKATCLDKSLWNIEYSSDIINHKEYLPQKVINNLSMKQS